MKRKPLYIFVVRAVIPLVVLAAATARGQITFTDGTFQNGDWTKSVINSTNGATDSVAQVSAGGNPGAYRFMEHDLPPSSSISVFHSMNVATYTPKTEGPIVALNYSEDQIEFNPPFPGATIGAQPAIQQDGVLYLGPDFTFGTTSWATATRNGLAATDFISLTNTNPDFTATGNQILFGYLRSNTNTDPESSETTQHGIDNFSYTVAREAVCQASSVYSEVFTSGQEASPQAEQHWVAFRQSLVPTDYDTVTISGTFDATGLSINDASIVPQIATALRNGIGGATWTVGGVTFNVGVCGSDSVESPAMEINANTDGSTVICQCPDPGWVVRPNLGVNNSSWGGANTFTCGGPTQTLIVTFSGPGTPSCGFPPPAMISWWKAEGNDLDSIGHNDLTDFGGVTFVAGEVGQAFNFETDQALTPGLPANLNITGNQVTIDGWINLNETTNQGVFFGKTESGQNDYTLFMLSSQLAGCIKTADNVEHFLYTGYVPPTGQWTHIAMTYDGATQTIYANGIVVGQQPVSGNIAGDSVNFWIGGRSNANDLTISAAIDEVEVFARALSGAEILDIYNSTCTGKCPCTDAPNGMVAWWPANGDAVDVRGSNDGTLINGATFDQGAVHQGFSLNGDAQYVDVPDSAQLSITGPMTIDAWIKANDIASEHAIVEKYDGGGTNGYFFRLSSGTGRLVFGICNSSTCDAVTGATQVTTGTFHHVAAVFDGANLQVYLDGNLDNGAATGIVPTDGTNSLEIGARGGSPGNFFSGIIDEVEIFNRALSPSEIFDIYHAGSSGKCPTCVSAPGENDQLVEG